MINLMLYHYINLIISTFHENKIIIWENVKLKFVKKKYRHELNFQVVINLEKISANT